MKSLFAKGAALFALSLFFMLNGIHAQEYARVTVDEKSRQAQIIAKEIEGQEMRGVLLYAQNAWYKIFFYKNDLPLLRQAAEKYFSEFNALKLKKGKKETLKKYGSAPLFIEWGSGKDSIDRFSDTRADLGYAFVKQAPYFIISIDSAKNKNQEQNKLAYQNSSKLTLLFTRAQLADLLQKIE